MTKLKMKIMGRVLMMAAVIVGGCLQVSNVNGSIDDEELVSISSGAQPRLVLDVHRDGRKLLVVLEVAAFNADGSGVEPTIGLAASKSKLLQSAEAKVKRKGGCARFTWSVAGRDLVDRPEDWKHLRMGIDVRWAGGPNGTDRRHERYRHIDGRAPSAGLSPRPEDWAPLDLNDLSQQIADRRDRLSIPVNQPMDGKLTVVIEDEAGKRVRNLIAGVSAPKGPQRILWDGFDEEGRLVKEGRYHWRSIHHPGIIPEFVTDFANADEKGFKPLLSNHCHFTAAGANGEWVVLAAVGSEGGFAMAAFDRTGSWRQGFNPILGTGWAAVAVALDDQYLYAAHDGQASYQKIDKSTSNWVGEVAVTLSRFDLKTGEVVEYKGATRWSDLERHPWGPGSTNAVLREEMSLSGMALLGGKLYIGSRAANALLVVDPLTGKQIGTIPLSRPGALASGGGKLMAVSEGRPMLVDVVARTARPYFTADQERALALDTLEVKALALEADGRCYIVDGKRHIIKAIEINGKVAELGKSGGRYAGAWQPERMVAPCGLAVLGNWLWVAEDRVLPKRAVAWNVSTRQVVRQVFGNPNYGGPAAGFDPADATRWVGEGASWKLDMERKSAECLGIMGWTQTLPMHWRFIRQEGRTYLLGMGMANILTLVRDDGTVRPVAAWASAHCFSYAWQWNPPAGFVEAFNAAYPDKKFEAGTRGRPEHGPGLVWVDRNGDGIMQKEEFEFSGSEKLGGAAWGHDLIDLTLRLTVTLNGKPALLALKPEGVDANGVPRYPHLREALAAAVPLRGLTTASWNGFGCASSVDRAGDVIVLSEPMTCWAPDGSLRWSYPNPWSNVHGSHAAPLPEIGVMQGALFILGMAPIDSQSDVFMINGNHGRFFVVTSDGLYLDEMFNDCRVAQTRDAMLVGGECFGGVFGRDDAGRYWLQTGGEGFRIYRIKGLDQIRRDQGTITVTAPQLLVAQRHAERRQAEAAVDKVAILEHLAKRPACDGTGNGWPSGQAVTWAQRGKSEGLVQARIGFDSTNLYLSYAISSDSSPWVNNGKDWTLLFKTGDSVDLQLGTDASAAARRKGPVPGDIRLLMAPMGTQTVAVVYRHRVPGTKQGTVFSSPTRNEMVDVVKRLDNVKIGVRPAGDGYRVEAAIPLAELGFSPNSGGPWKADFGVIYGDDAGTINLLRSYWANRATGLVNDVPGEMMLQPDFWGTLKMEEQ